MKRQNIYSPLVDGQKRERMSHPIPSFFFIKFIETQAYTWQFIFCSSINVSSAPWDNLRYLQFSLTTVPVFDELIGWLYITLSNHSCSWTLTPWTIKTHIRGFLLTGLLTTTPNEAFCRNQVLLCMGVCFCVRVRFFKLTWSYEA